MALGVAVTSAVLVAALAIGDSVRQGLRHLAEARLAGTVAALDSRPRMVRELLAEKLSNELSVPVVPALRLDGVLATPDGALEIPDVVLYGVDDRFWRLGGEDDVALAEGRARVAPALAAALGDRLHGPLIFRTATGHGPPGDMPMALEEAPPLAIRLVAEPYQGPMAPMGPAQQPTDPRNAFVPLGWLQKQAGLEGRVNQLFLGPGAGASDEAAQAAQEALGRVWDLADLGLRLEPSIPGFLDLTSERILLDPAVSWADQKLGAHQSIFTWFVDTIRAGEKSVPFSFVTELGGRGADGALLPAPLEQDEILVNRWLADELAVKEGDTLELVYHTVDDRASGRPSQTHAYTVRGILPMKGPGADATLTPAYPGMAEAERCRDWKPGVPLDLSRIRAQDEAYWKAYGGAPKAILSSPEGRARWGSAFGHHTALRFPSEAAQETRARILEHVDPLGLGLSFRPVASEARAAAEPATDFATLFLGFGIVLVVASLVLTALLFSLGIVRRKKSLWALWAMGFPAAQIRRLLLAEGLVVVSLGAALGCLIGPMLTTAALHALGGVWSDAVAGLPLHLALVPRSFAIAAAASVLVSQAAIAWVSGRLLRRFGEPASSRGPSPSLLWGPLSLGISALLAASAVSLVVLPSSSLQTHGATAFFLAGALCLVAGLTACHGLFALLQRPGRFPTSITALVLQGMARHPTRSLSVVASLACATFLVVGVGANHRDPERGAYDRSSGTAGFALVAETTTPLRMDPSHAHGRAVLGLDGPDFQDAEFTAVQIRGGDDASCLSLGSPQRPLVYGIDPKVLASRGAFRFQPSAHPEFHSPWDVLEREAKYSTVPVVGDEATVVWGLGLSVGDVIQERDELGGPVQFEIFGILETTMLQGGLIASSRVLAEHFPTQSARTMLLVDAPAEQRGPVATALQAALGDHGVTVEPAWQRLARFQRVENTYLAIFLALGFLGLVVGSLGVGTLVARHVAERRRELAVLLASGFSPRRVRWVVLGEHGLLLLLGLLVGAASALVAVWPSASASTAEVPVGTVLGLMGVVFAVGLTATWTTTRVVLRGPLAPALREP